MVEDLRSIGVETNSCSIIQQVQVTMVEMHIGNYHQVQQGQYVMI